jgi:hypothetical protein
LTSRARSPRRSGGLPPRNRRPDIAEDYQRFAQGVSYLATALKDIQPQAQPPQQHDPGETAYATTLLTTAQRDREGERSAQTQLQVAQARAQAQIRAAEISAEASRRVAVDVELDAAAVLAAGKALVVEHRNAANAATVKQLGGCSAGQSRTLTIRRLTLAANERVRVVVGAVAFGAGETATAAIQAYPV